VSREGYLEMSFHRRRYRAGAVTFLAGTIVVSLLGGLARANLQSRGPISPDNGFPESYTDNDGLTLGLCLDTGGNCLLELPNPGQPVSFPDNFGPEAFYFLAEATMPTNGGGAALCVLALEAAFINEEPIDGDQVVFARIRFRVDNLVDGETYTVTHPYGVDVFVAEGAGRRGINFTEDVGIAAGMFNGALAGRIGPFLQWDPAESAPPAGFIGNPNVPHTVIGSPFGTNFFRVQGPNVGGPGVHSIETDQFAVSGQIAPGAPQPFDFASLRVTTKIGTPFPDVGHVSNEDIVQYDMATTMWSRYFDGSDVGLAAARIDAFTCIPGGDILMSFDAPFNVPGLTGGPNGTLVDDSDIVRFTPTSLGENTAGSFSFFFDGSDVGLTTSNEDIDGLGYDAPRNRLFISINGTGSVPGVSNVQDEDMIRFNIATSGASTSGTWTLIMDGSDLGLGTSASEDIDGIYRSPATGDFVFSTIGNFSAGGASGNESDLFRFIPVQRGATTTGNLGLVVDSAAIGIPAAADVGDIDITE